MVPLLSSISATKLQGSLVAVPILWDQLIHILISWTPEQNSYRAVARTRLVHSDKGNPKPNLRIRCRSYSCRRYMCHLSQNQRLTVFDDPTTNKMSKTPIKRLCPVGIYKQLIRNLQRLPFYLWVRLCNQGCRKVIKIQTYPSGRIESLSPTTQSCC